MMKYLALTVLLTVSALASSRIENKFECIDNKLFVKTIVYEETQYGTHVVSASLVQILSQWGSSLAVTDCKTHEVKLK